MRGLIVILLVVTGILGGDALKGNRAYGDGDYARAEEAYRKAMTRAADLSPDHRFALEHNLAAALYRSGEYEDARIGFERAANLAPDRPERARAAYNAGTAAMAAGSYAEAADLFRQSLRANPGDEDARINYEYARRMAPPPDDEEQDLMHDGQDEADEDESDGDDDSDSSGPEGSDGAPDDQSGEEGAPSQEPGASDPTDTPPHDDEGEGLPEDAPPEMPQTEPTMMTEEEAEQILNALQRSEGQLMREVQRAPAIPRRVEKDW